MLKYTIKNIADISDEEYKKSYSLMNPQRREKIQRLKGEASQKRTLAGEWLSRRLLSHVTGQNPGFFSISPDEYGKPQLENFSDIFFNISHSKNTIVAAVCDEKIGVDIEEIRPVSPKLAKKICTAEELLYIFGKAPTCADFDDNLNPLFLKRFFEIWTIKEAYFKYIGTGITEFQTVSTLSDSFSKIKIENDNFIVHMVTSAKAVAEFVRV